MNILSYYHIRLDHSNPSQIKYNKSLPGTTVLINAPILSQYTKPYRKSRKYHKDCLYYNKISHLKIANIYT